MTQHEEYESIVEKRYKKYESESYEMMGYYSAVLLAPYQYETEAEMLDYLKKNPNATLKEAFVHFDEITPDGLAPGDDGADLMDDD